jgi:N-acetyl-gamma-glutamyl-phosphate reductase
VQNQYEGETFVHVLPKGGIPHTRHVRGSNHNLISVFPDRLPGRAIVLSGQGRPAALACLPQLSQ